MTGVLCTVYGAQVYFLILKIWKFAFSVNMKVLPCSDVYKSNNLVKSFQDIMENIFMPLFEVTRNPKSHPKLHAFLMYVSNAAKIQSRDISEFPKWRTSLQCRYHCSQSKYGLIVKERTIYPDIL